MKEKSIFGAVTFFEKGLKSALTAWEKQAKKGGSYYPFGMTMPGATWESSAYRYAFNGKEKDDETQTLDYGFRISDPRLGGRFWSVDPLSPSFPWNSPYAFAEGDPINFTDLDGAEKPTTAANQTITKTKPATTNKALLPGGYLLPATLAAKKAVEKVPWWRQFGGVARTLGGTALATVFTLFTSSNDPSRYTGIYDDRVPYIPPAFKQDEREDKLKEYIDKRFPMINSREPDAVLYELRAKQAGWYDCYNCDGQSNTANVRLISPSGKYEIYLEDKEVWKYGKNNIGLIRYLPNSYELTNFDRINIDQGTESEILIKEKSMIVSYPWNVENITRFHKGGTYIPRPPGNKRDK